MKYFRLKNSTKFYNTTDGGVKLCTVSQPISSPMRIETKLYMRDSRSIASVFLWQYHVTCSNHSTVRHRRTDDFTMEGVHVVGAGPRGSGDVSLPVGVGATQAQI